MNKKTAPSRRRATAGLTLVELMTTLAVGIMLLSVGVPSYQSVVENQHIQTRTNELVGHLHLARSESVKMNAQVAICVSLNSASCTGGNWQDGWIVYVDQDANNSFDAGETILRTQQALGGGNQITASMGNQIVYDNRGFAAQGSAGTLQLCDNRQGDHGKTLTISNTGRVRVQDGTAC